MKTDDETLGEVIAELKSIKISGGSEHDLNLHLVCSSVTIEVAGLVNLLIRNAPV